MMETIQALSQIFATEEYSLEFLLGLAALGGAVILYLVGDVFGGIHL